MKKILMILTLIVTNNAIAADASSGYVSIADNSIQIISRNDPRLYLYDVPINTSESGCTKTTPVLLLDSTQVLAKEMYSMLLTAKSTGKRVNILTSGCYSNGNFPKIFSIYLE